MPHKMNTRSLRADQRPRTSCCAGHLAMVAALAGDQWNEGDVSCSVVRRVALPDAFFADRRPVRDVPHRARRARRLPGGHRARAATATCRSWRPPRCSWPRCGRRRPRGGPRGDQGARRGRRPRDAREGRRRQRPARPAGRRRAPRPRRGRARRRSSPSRSTFAGAAAAQVAAFVARVEAVAAPPPDAAAYDPRPIL